jgi:hypothetical protein
MLMTIGSASAAFLALTVRNMQTEPSRFAVQLSAFIGFFGFFIFISLLVPYLLKLLRDSLRSDSIRDKNGNVCKKGTFDYWFGITQIFVVLIIVLCFIGSLLFTIIF